MKKQQHLIVSIVFRIVLATALTSAAFWVLLHPLAVKGLGSTATRLVALVLDLPVSALNAILPTSVRTPYAIQFVAIPHSYPAEGAGEFLHYLAVGVPAWLGVLLMPALVRATRATVTRIRTERLGV